MTDPTPLPEPPTGPPVGDPAPEPWPPDGRRLLVAHRTSAGAWLERRVCINCGDLTSAFFLLCPACRAWGE